MYLSFLLPTIALGGLPETEWTLVAASQSVDALMSLYVWSTGLWQNGMDDASSPWWQSGNALQALLDYMAVTGDTAFLEAALNTIDRQRMAPLQWWPTGGVEFRADSTDDTGWWALALVRLYDITGDESHLQLARSDFDYLRQFWDPTVCAGGIVWDIEHRQYKNAISNELYIKLAASLHNRLKLAAEDHNATVFLDHAMKALEWFLGSGMINDDNLINDGLYDENCTNNGDTTWTYNQGVILGALAELYLATGDASFLELATSISDAVVADPLLTSPTGIEPCEHNQACNVDQASFKGIFARNLGELNRVRVLHSGGQPQAAYLLRQVQSLYESGRQNHHYGLGWAGPYNVSTFSVGTQASAVSLFTSVLLLERRHSTQSTSTRTILCVLVAVGIVVVLAVLLFLRRDLTQQQYTNINAMDSSESTCAEEQDDTKVLTSTEMTLAGTLAHML